MTSSIHIRSTFRSVQVTAVDEDGNMLFWTARDNSDSSTRFQLLESFKDLAEDTVSKIKEFDITSVRIFVHGPGQGREIVIQAMQRSGVEILMISDTTPIPHNGCRPRKKSNRDGDTSCL